jgi:membrane fusion protein, multidrug efflux system
MTQVVTPPAGTPSSGHAPAPVERRHIIRGAIIIALLLLALLLVGILPHRTRQRDLDARARAAALADSIPLVAVAPVTRSAADADLMLPGTLQSNHVTPIYARSSGYVQHWYADIGARVHAGQLLATVEAPDLDQELAQGQQQEANARATLQLNAVTLERWKVLYHDSVVTKQELDTYQSNYDASVASVAAAQANVKRLGALVGFLRITSPFDGVITARNVDDGVFVTASGTINTPQPAGIGGNTIVGATAAPTELFRVASTDTFRLYVGVPQAYAPGVRAGLPAILAVPENPGRSFAGRIIRTADAVDASSLTLLTEVDVINSDHSLLPGMFAQAHFRFDRVHPPILMPGTAMIFRTSAPQAAVLGTDSILHFHTLQIGRDYGTVIEVDSGLADGAYVVVNPADNLRDGQPVHARLEVQNGAPGGDTRAGRPVLPPPQELPGAKGRRGQGNATGGQAVEQSGSQTGGAAAGTPPRSGPPEVQEGFPAAPPAPKP